jgi:pimeloyl-ACP methyl ester carboxylesterase
MTTLLAAFSPVRADEQPHADTSLRFAISLDSSLQSQPYTGRLYVVVSSESSREPRLSMGDWFAPAQVFSVDVNELAPEKPALIDGRSRGYPKKFTELVAGEYQVQGIARRNLDHPFPGKGPGDLYCEPRTIKLDWGTTGTVELVLNKTVEPKPFNETQRVRYFEMASPLLSRFHGREMKIRAGVVLPADWTEADNRKYPVLYVIGGFGDSHHAAHRIASATNQNDGRDNVLRVAPDPTCYRGHSVFVDSENNGPWGRALVEELIPAVERKFHGAETGSHRYVMGVSSGGWTALWLQIAYPEQFNGCWAHCPDPVDFRDFQRIDLYGSGSNMYVDEKGARRPLARFGERVAIYYDDFVHQEEVLGPGGQIHSFEAVFSRKGSDGQPMPLFDRRTGAINNDVAKSWERFDIRLILERDRSNLVPKLAKKLHVFAGENDTFYLEGAVRLLRDSLTKLGSDAEVAIVPNMAHGLHREAVGPMYATIRRNAEPLSTDSGKGASNANGG